MNNLTKTELMNLAKEFQIKGRSKMNKMDLLNALTELYNESLRFFDGKTFNYDVIFSFDNREEIKDFINKYDMNLSYEDYTDLFEEGSLSPDKSGHEWGMCFCEDRYGNCSISYRTIWGLDDEDYTNEIAIIRVLVEAKNEFNGIIDPKVHYWGDLMYVDNFLN